MRILVTVFIVTSLLLAGCAGVDTTPVKVVPPAGCEASLFWKYNFMPLGPGVAVSGLEIALLARPEATLPVRTALTTIWPIIKTGDVAQVKAILRKGEVTKFFVPVISLLEQWEKAGLLPKVKVDGVEKYQLGDCDKQILLDLVRDMAITAGAKPEIFL